MPTDVIMPQMGESIAEGTLIKWLKKPGEKIARDENLFEISTDKVDAEIPSPVAGILGEIKVFENETVPINTVVATILAEGEDAPAAEVQAERSTEILGSMDPASFEVVDQTDEEVPTTSEERIRQLSSPLVRSIAAKENVDIAEIDGTGIHGRVTKADILAFLEVRKSTPALAPALAAAPVAAPSAGASATPASPASLSGGGFLLAANSIRPTELPALPPPHTASENVTREPMSNMRKRIAENMIMSRRLNAHVTSFFEFDFSRVARTRAIHKDRFLDQHGVKLTYLPFLVKAVCSALRAHPIINAVIDGDDVVYKNDVNIGMAVAVDWGLIVPVIRNADQLSLAGIARSTVDLGNRARSRKLKIDDLAGGTFTITNPGVFGGLIGAPIIPVGQSAILGFGAIEKRPVVIDVDGQDAIVARQRAYMSISFDHRLIDGAIAEHFMSHVKQTIETADWPDLG